MTEPTHSALKQAAHAAVEQVRALARGEPFASLVTLAIAACVALRDAALDELFPWAIKPTTPAALAAYSHLTGRLGPVGYGDRIAELHERALTSDPDLAQLFRTRECLSDVEAAAGMRATPTSTLETHAEAERRAVAAARARYTLAIARQLAAHPEHDLAPAASMIIEADALASQLEHAEVEHKTHAALEAVRQREEHAAAARRARDQTIAKVRDAEAKRVDAHARAETADREYRDARAAGFIERLRLSGLTSLRLARGEGGVYAAADLVATAPRMSIAQLDRYESALAEHEAS